MILRQLFLESLLGLKRFPVGCELEGCVINVIQWVTIDATWTVDVYGWVLNHQHV